MKYPIRMPHKYIIVLLMTINVPVMANIPSGFSTIPIFSDEFNGATLDMKKWSQRYPGPRANCTNSERSVYLSDGHLIIKTFSENAGGKIKNYCGMIFTANKFAQAYGYWETSIRFKRAPGVQLAFWIQSPTMGKNVNNPERSGIEIDVFEHFAQAISKEYDHAIHWNGYGAAHKAWAKAKHMPDLDDGNFHKFAVAWTPKGYVFYVDDQFSEVVPATVPVSRALEHIIFSSEVPGSFPSNGYGSFDQSQATFEVDYVRVYPYLGGVNASPLR